MAARTKRPDKQLQDLRGMADADLAKELGETFRQLFTVRLQLSTRQLTNVSEPRKVRRVAAIDDDGGETLARDRLGRYR